jgi:hypothetical protein
MLVTDRRRSFGMRDEQHEQDPPQGSLFAPDSLAPPARPPGPTPDPFAGARARPARPRERGAPSAYVAPPADPPEPAEVLAPADLPEPADVLAPADLPEPADVLAPADYLDDPAELDPAHAHPAAARNLLAGPTLDDIMSRAWEGLRAEVPTPCPVCHAEIEPSAGGRCGSCGSTLD